MTDGVDLIYTILDVAAANYTNYGAKPNIKRDHIDNLFFMKPGEIGIKLANVGRDTGQDHQGLVILRKYKVAMTINETTRTKRDALLADVESLFATTGVVFDSLDFDEVFPNLYGCIAQLIKLGA